MYGEVYEIDVYRRRRRRRRYRVVEKKKKGKSTTNARTKKHSKYSLYRVLLTR